MSDSPDQKLRALGLAYRGRLPERFKALERAWHLARQGDANALEALRGDVHRLAGSGAMYGLPRVSECARALLDRLQAITAGVQGPGPRLDAVQAALADLGRAIREA